MSTSMPLQKQHQVRTEQNTIIATQEDRRCATGELRIMSDGNKGGVRIEITNGYRQHKNKDNEPDRVCMDFDHETVVYICRQFLRTQEGPDE